MSDTKTNPYMSALEDTSNATVQALSGIRVVNLENAFANYEQILQNSVRTKSGAINQLADDKLRGFVFEAHHKGTFNIDAASKGYMPEDIQAYVGNDTLSDGSVLSPHDTRTDIVVESRSTLRQKFGVDDPKVKEYQAKVYESREKTLSQLEKYDDTYSLGPADQTPEYGQVEETYRGKSVKSEKMTNEESIKVTQSSKEGKVEYANKQQRRNELRCVNFKTAVGVSAIAGAASALISEITDICVNKKHLTAEKFQKAIVNVLKGAADGGARGGVLFLAAEIFGVTGLKSVPGMAAANTLYDFAKDLYHFINGKMDGDDLLCNTVTNAFTSTVTFAGAQLGMSAAVSLGATLGTAVGPFGTLVGGAIGGLIGGLGSSAIVAGAQKDAFLRVQADIETVIQSTTLDPRMTQLRMVEKMSSLSEIEFSFKDLIPMYNIIGDLAEYNHRKKAIKQVRQQVSETRKGLDEQFARAEERLIEHHEQRCRELEWQFKSARRHLTQKYKDAFKQEIGEEFQSFQASYSVAFGHLQTSYDELASEQAIHKNNLYQEEQRREAFQYYLKLVDEVLEETSQKDIEYLVSQIRVVISNDKMLKNLSYIDRQDILNYLNEGMKTND